MPDTKTGAPRVKRPSGGRKTARERAGERKRRFAAESEAMTYAKKRQLRASRPRAGERTRHEGNAPLRRVPISDAGKLARAIQKRLRRMDALQAKADAGEQLDVQQVKALADNAEQRPTLERELAILEGEGDLDEGEPGGKAGDAAGD